MQGRGQYRHICGSCWRRLVGRADFDAATKGWLNAGGNVILAKSGKMNVADAKRFEFTLSASFVLPSEKFICTHGETTWGQSVYVVGNVERLGNWNPAAAIKLDPNGPYPTWAGIIDKLPPATPVEWKCIKRPENAAFPVVWQPGSNNAFTSAASGSGGTTTGDFAGGAPGGALAQFVCDNGTTQLGQSVYAVGDAPSLGLGDPAKALKLDPTAYPRWTGTVANLPPATTIKWKCIKRPGNAASPVVSQPSSDSQFTTFTTGSSGSTSVTQGNFQP